MFFLFSVPDPPSNLREKSKGTSYIEIQWNEPTGGKDSYEIRYKKASEPEASYQSRSVGNELTAHQIDTLIAGETYDIGIKTISGTEESTCTDTRITTGNSTMLSSQGNATMINDKQYWSCIFITFHVLFEKEYD